MKVTHNDISTTLEAENIIEMMRITTIGHLLTAGNASYQHTVKRWDLREIGDESSLRPDDRKPYGLASITYQRTDMDRIYELIGKYRQPMKVHP
jgi:hypothetical protein